MRRHSNSDNPDYSSTAAQQMCHPRHHSPAGAEQIILPTTLRPTLAMLQPHSATIKESTPAQPATAARNRRKRRLGNHNDNSRRCPTTCLVVHNNNGVTTVNSNVIKYFVLVGALFLLGVHVYLYRQLSSAQQEEHNLLPPVLQSATNATASRKTTTTRRQLTPLTRPIDREKFTIRINTWQRLDQLLVSIDHHASCPGVAQIQVVWCEPIEPPASLLALHPDKVVLERHAVNSLNERFHILPSSQTPTLGILSMDDDVLRPCDAMDAGFFQWTQSPSRFVGFDFRIHVEEEDGTWKYGYLSTTQKANRYSMSLPRYAFLHRDYLDWYMTDLPRPIFDHVAAAFNCEDIAMSFFISSLTDGRPPLLAHFWAIDSMVKLYSPKKISGTKNHKALRDACVESFAQQLDLKDRLKDAHVLHRNDTMFYCGDKHYQDDLDINNMPKRLVGSTSDSNLRAGNSASDVAIPERQVTFTKKINQWRKRSRTELQSTFSKMKQEASVKAKLAGLIEHSDEWNEKYHNKE